jgi:hypothetical protein
VSNHSGSLAWAAARPRTTVPSARTSSRALGLLPGGAYPSLECETGRPGDVKQHVEQHVFATSAAVQAKGNAKATAKVDVLVKDTGIRMPLGPPPWRPPE